MTTETTTLRTAKGKTVETSISDLEALSILRNMDNPSNFASDLVVKSKKKRGLSHDQIVWVHVIANEATGKGEKKPDNIVPGFGSVIVYLKTAREAGIKWPKVRLTTSDGKRLVLSITGDQSKRPGIVNLTDGGPYGDNVWYGRINKSGDLERSRKMTDEVFDLISEFAKNPGETAAAQGRLTGSCCFCGRALDTKESVGAGYGPVCAKKWGLPWGSSTAKKYEEKKELAVSCAGMENEHTV